MAAANLLALLDDIATILDDVALMTKVAAKKTAGVLGDDLALNAEQVAGVRADRELPVVWAVGKGSLVNKAILVPAALAISALAPWLVTPLLMLGGLYLCFEGVEKLAHKLLHKHDAKAHRAEHEKAVADPAVDLVAMEKAKIKGAVRTDLVLSAEIITISLGVVATAPFLTRVAALCGVALIMTVGVYGFVAAIVKLDDLGLYLNRRQGEGMPTRLARLLGRLVLRLAPWLMKGLSIAGTVAMFLVGGGILRHGIAPLHHLQEALTAQAAAVAASLGSLTSSAVDGLAGIIAGALALAVVTLGQRIVKGRKGSPDVAPGAH